MTPAQLGGLTPEQWRRILSGEAMSIDDAYYTAERTGGNVSMDNYDPGTLTGRVMRVPVSGNQYQMLDSAGNVEQTLDGYRSKGFFGDLLSHAGSIAKDTAPIWLAALGANYLAPGMAGGEVAALTGAGEAAAAGGGLLGGGGSALTPAAIEAGLGTAGYGYNASAAASGMFNPATIGAGAGLTFGPGVAGAAGAAAGGAGAAGGLGSLAGGMSGKVIGGLLGAAAGAANSGDKTQTSQQRLDPRMEAMLYGADGKGGYLGAATEWFNQNKGGNPLMLQGAQMMADFYRSPQYTEGYNSLRSAGLGLLNTPMAGNPFLRG